MWKSSVYMLISCCFWIGTSLWACYWQAGCTSGPHWTRALGIRHLANCPLWFQGTSSSIFKGKWAELINILRQKIRSHPLSYLLSACTVSGRKKCLHASNINCFSTCSPLRCCVLQRKADTFHQIFLSVQPLRKVKSHHIAIYKSDSSVNVKIPRDFLERYVLGLDKTLRIVLYYICFAEPMQHLRQERLLMWMHLKLCIWLTLQWQRGHNWLQGRLGEHTSKYQEKEDLKRRKHQGLSHWASGTRYLFPESWRAWKNRLLSLLHR